jgi:hypothetical protein
MAAVVFDTLQFARRLKEAGVPDKQAEAQAEVMAETFVYHMDKLVTTDYLDARLDARFNEQDARIDARFSEQDARIDARFSEQDARIDKRFAALDLKISGVTGELNLQRWILAAIAASTVIPALNSVFS